MVTLRKLLAVLCLLFPVLIQAQTRNVCFEGNTYYGFNLGAVDVDDAKKADMDNDGNQDFVIASKLFSQVVVMKGDYAGGFTYQDLTPQNLGFNFPASLATGKFGRDTLNDLAIGNVGNLKILLLKNNGGLNFSLYDSIDLGGITPTSLESGDFNGDGFTDLIVASSDSNRIMVFNGDALGHFTLAYNIPAATGPGRMCVADMNNDGHPDILIPLVINAVRVLYYDFTNHVYNANDYACTFSPSFVCAADINHDGQLDIVAGSQAGGNSGTYYTLAPYFNQWTTLNVQSVTGALAAGDVNNDGYTDLVDNYSTYLNNRAGGLTFASSASLTEYTMNFAFVYDANHDGRPDIIYFSSASDPFMISLWGLGNGQFDGPSEPDGQTGYGTLIGSTNVTADGPQSLVVMITDGYGTYIATRTALGNGQFSAPADVTGYLAAYPATVTPVAYKDINNDGIKDLILSYSNFDISAGSEMVWYGTQSGFVQKANVSTTAFYRAPGTAQAVGDFNGDTYNDIIAPVGGTDLTVFANNHGNSYVLDTSNIPLLTPLLAADFNADGRSDVVTVSNVTNNILVYTDSAGYRFNKPDTIKLFTAPSWAVSADLNRDGRNDMLLFDHQQTGTIYLFYSNPAGSPTFLPYDTILLTNAWPEYVYVADINGDSLTDIILISQQSTMNETSMSVMLRQPNGKYAPPVYYSCGDGTALFADLNNDGVMDVMTVGDWFTYRTGRKDGTFDSAMVYSTGIRASYPLTPLLMDVNNDHKPDLVTQDPLAYYLVEILNMSAPFYLDTVNYCQYSSIGLNAGFGDQYLWNNDSVTEFTLYGHQGPAWITISNDGGCVSSDTFFARELPAPVKPIISNVPQRYLCGNTTFQLSVDSSYRNASWWPGSVSSYQYTVRDSGTFYVEVTGSNGCTIQSDPVHVTKVFAPVLNISNNPLVCYPADVKFFVTNGPYDTLMWNGQTTTDTLNITDSSAVWVNATSYGCSLASDTVHVAVYQAPPVQFNLPLNDTICQGQMLNLQVTNFAAYDSILWSNHLRSSSITADTTNAFSVFAAKYGCSVHSDTLYVNEKLIPTPVISNPYLTKLCPADTAVIFLTRTYDQYAWNDGDTTAATQVAANGAYFVTCYLNGCRKISDTVYVAKSNSQKPVLSYTGRDTLCMDSHATVSVNVSNPNLVTWYNAGNTVTTHVNSVSISNTGQYYVELNDTFGCTFYSDTLPLYFQPLPVVAFQMPEDTLCKGGAPLALTGGTPPGGQYSGIGVSGGSFHPNSTGHFSILYTYTDSIGCSANASAAVQVKLCTTGIADNGADVQIKVYPNPASDRVYVQSTELMNEVSLYSANGDQVYVAQPGTTQMELPMGKLAAGVYFVLVKSAGGEYRTPVVKF